MIILYMIRFILLSTSSHDKPVPKSKTPIITKSIVFQFTSLVSCIAMNGISRSITTAESIMINRLFFILVLFLSII